MSAFFHIPVLNTLGLSSEVIFQKSNLNKDEAIQITVADAFPNEQEKHIFKQTLSSNQQSVFDSERYFKKMESENRLLVARIETFQMNFSRNLISTKLSVIDENNYELFYTDLRFRPFSSMMISWHPSGASSSHCRLKSEGRFTENAKPVVLVWDHQNHFTGFHS